mmetsp:Transcript_16744/g.21168  ORF Transcript_16744/g.21168 Transcript_16744/m.21168 type:complete len:90 (-) Transcript_16744:514-783(-)
MFFESWKNGLEEDERNQLVLANQQNQIYSMIVNNRRKLAIQLNRTDLMPRELTQKETYEAFDVETNLRMEIIDLLEQVPEQDIKTEDEI